jgi:hypothetical protein
MSVSDVAARMRAKDAGGADAARAWTKEGELMSLRPRHVECAAERCSAAAPIFPADALPPKPTSRPAASAARDRLRTIVRGEVTAEVKTSDAPEAGWRESAALILGEVAVRLKDAQECGRHRKAEAAESGGDVRLRVEQ